MLVMNPLVPEMIVSDLSRSLHFYCDVLEAGSRLRGAGVLSGGGMTREGSRAVGVSLSSHRAISLAVVLSQRLAHRMRRQLSHKAMNLQWISMTIFHSDFC